MGAVPESGLAVCVVYAKLDILVFLAQRNLNSGACSKAGINRRCDLIFGAELIFITAAQHKQVLHGIFQSGSELILRERVGGKVAQNGDPVIFGGVKVIRQADVEDGGQFKTGAPLAEGQVVVRIACPLGEDGKAFAAEGHSGADVAQGDTEFEILFFPGDILDSGIDSKTGCRYVGYRFGNQAEQNAHRDFVFENVRVTQAQVEEIG